MHRSGTSFLAGTLQGAGLDLGEASTFDKHNRKGNRERRDIVAFHDAVLEARGHAWNAPPEGRITWTAEERAAARDFTPAAGGPWGFKDPRALLMAEEWMALHPGARRVGIVRHPVMVARSLAARGTRKVKGPAAFALWAAYNQRLLALHEADPFPILSFDAPPERLATQIAGLLPDLGLAPDAAGAFFDPELRHHEREAEKPPQELRPLYAELMARRVGA